MAEMTAHSLPIPEDLCSNPVLATVIEHLFAVNCLQKGRK